MRFSPAFSSLIPTKLMTTLRYERLILRRNRGTSQKYSSEHGCQIAIARFLESYVFGPSGFWTMAPLRYAAKFDPFLSLDCAPMPSTLAQSKERTGSNFAIWQPWFYSPDERLDPLFVLHVKVVQPEVPQHLVLADDRVRPPTHPPRRTPLRKLRQCCHVAV